ncbi:M20 peptidase aminoacylase family protein [Pseudogracilibacillus auburnensis]|uniref:M20 peptidase aminoacylase family protein n=1 Tax=Pseudogracilibacillus auburnensis TaxID=1494959 RepID=UPI001A964960|nr:M20 peptidase aminoacylase family protein [Pseudogracilibacillus auburnensis]MBO1002533.1 M20 peptidase aminoacylase family protein [Pseudogracilibacillus auburnensis]
MKTTIKQLTTRLTEIFNHLHTHPEISWQEENTTNYIQSLFEREDCKITTFNDLTGLMIEIGSGKPVIALRADIDALWQEVDGKFQANHSCGHDAHMTIVIGTLLTLLECDLPSRGTFRFIFQPAEEKGTGALAFVEKGIVDDVDYLYGMHLRPIEELPNGKFAAAIQHGAAKFMKGEIIGEDAHGARPHLNANAIQVGTELFQHMNNIQVNPIIPYSAKLTSFQAGGKSSNIIPGNATFSIDLRAQTNEVMDQLTEKVEQIASMLATFHNVQIKVSTSAGVAAAVINDQAAQIMEDAILQVVGAENLAPIIESTGGDDFHFYTIKRPQIKATMLAIGCDLKPGLHHPHMTFNHEVIPIAIEILTKALLETAVHT